MAIKSILVPVENEDQLPNVLEAALVVARRFSAHISVLHISESALRAGVYVDMSQSLKEQVLKEEKRILMDSRSSIDDLVERFAKRRRIKLTDTPQSEAGVSISSHHEFGQKRELLIEWSRLFDTTAVMRPESRKGILGRRLYGDDMETILLYSGRPTLIVPPEWNAHKAQHAVVAWNNSLEASRALAMTLPWLVEMKRVTVVVSRKRQENGERVVRHLEWHGAKAELKILNRRTSTAGRRILKICDQEGADFLVMGGYSHSRMKEHVLGGVTDHVLHNSRVITVMAH